VNDDRIERLEQELRHLRSELPRALEKDKALAEERLAYAEQIIRELREKAGGESASGQACRIGQGISDADSPKALLFMTDRIGTTSQGVRRPRK
jgi:hypothetical protein